MTDPVVEFRDAVLGYCAVVEAAPPEPRTIVEHLAALVTLAVRLPDVEPSSEVPAVEGVEVAGTAAIATRLLQALGPRDIYWEVYDPRVEEAHVAGSLSDDLADVHRDLRRGLAEFDAGRIDDAVWEWRFSFEVHWGLHAVDAMRVLHRLAYG